jgi:methionyl-tRNA formyltransferase
MGTPDFAVPSLRALAGDGHHLVAVVTQPDRKRGRGRKLSPPPVKEAALELGLAILQPEKASDEDFCSKISRLKPDLIVVVAYGQILRCSLLEIPSWGVLNIHSSLLPKYRGAAPIQWALISNESETGLSAMALDEGMDTGPVFLQETVTIQPGDTAGSIHDRLADLSGGFLLKAIRGISEGTLEAVSQDDEKASYAPKIDRATALINWNRHADAISALIRGLDPIPGAFTMLGGRQLKLFSPMLDWSEKAGTIPGRVTGTKGEFLAVETGMGLLRIRELQMEGKKRMPASEFLRGFPIEPGTILGE